MLKVLNEGVDIARQSTFIYSPTSCHLYKCHLVEGVSISPGIAVAFNMVFLHSLLPLDSVFSKE